MHQHGHNDPNAGKLYELIKDVKIAMMTTVDTDGTLHSRPMHNKEADEHGDLWFFTQIQSPKTRNSPATTRSTWPIPIRAVRPTCR